MINLKRLQADDDLDERNDDEGNHEDRSRVEATIEKPAEKEKDERRARDFHSSAHRIGLRCQWDTFVLTCELCAEQIRALRIRPTGLVNRRTI